MTKARLNGTLAAVQFIGSALGMLTIQVNAAQTVDSVLTAPNGVTGTIALADAANAWGGTQDFTGATVKVAAGPGFNLEDPTDPTKVGQFALAGLTTGTTRTYTMPDASGTVALLGLAQAWTAQQDFTGTTILVATVAPGDNTTKAASTAFVTAAIAASGGTNPMTTLGDMVVGGAAGAETRLAGNITATPMYLKSTGTGSAATTPAWTQIAFTDLSGSVDATQMPALTGDVTMTAGTTATTLATTQPNAHTWSAQQTFNGNLGVLTAPTVDNAVNVAGTLTGSVSTTQTGIASQSKPTSSATTSYTGIYFRAASAAAAYTQASTYGAYIDSPLKGAGSTMTTLYGLYVAAQSLGGTNYAIFSNAGWVRFGDNVAINATPNADTVLRITGALPSSVAAGQIGIDLEAVPTSSATGSMIQLYTRPRSATASYTQSAAYAFYIDSPGYGAGSTVTTGYGLYIGNQTGAGTNYAIKTNTGLVNIGDSTATTSSSTGAIVVSGGIACGAGFYAAGTGGSNGAFQFQATTSVTAGGNVGLFAVNQSTWTGVAAATYTALTARSYSAQTGLSGGTFIGVNSEARLFASATGTLAGATSVQCTILNQSAGIITTAIGLSVLTPTNSGGGSITTAYGIKVENQSGAGTNYAIYAGTGLSVFNDATASTATTTGAVVVTGGVGIGGAINAGVDASSHALWGQTNFKKGSSSGVLRIAGGSNELLQFGASVGILNAQFGAGASNNANGAFVDTTSAGVTNFYQGTTAILAASFTATGNFNMASSKVIQVNGVQVVAARKTGWTPWTGTATRTTFATGSATLQNVAEALKALIDDLHQTAGHGLIGT